MELEQEIVEKFLNPLVEFYNDYLVVKEKFTAFPLAVQALSAYEDQHFDSGRLLTDLLPEFSVKVLDLQTKLAEVKAVWAKQEGSFKKAKAVYDRYYDAFHERQKVLLLGFLHCATERMEGDIAALRQNPSGVGRCIIIIRRRDSSCGRRQYNTGKMQSSTDKRQSNADKRRAIVHKVFEEAKQQASCSPSSPYPGKSSPLAPSKPATVVKQQLRNKRK